MRAILDTHILLWWLSEPKFLSKDQFDFISSKDTQILVSSASIWEIRIKEAVGKLEIPQDIINLIKEESIDFLYIPVPSFYCALLGRWLNKTTGIKYIDLDTPMEPLLDTARRLTHVDSVHTGIYLPKKYSGEGVVVGVDVLCQRVAQAGDGMRRLEHLPGVKRVLIRYRAEWAQKGAG